MTAYVFGPLIESPTTASTVVRVFGWLWDGNVVATSVVATILGTTKEDITEDIK